MVRIVKNDLLFNECIKKCGQVGILKLLVTYCIGIYAIPRKYKFFNKCVERFFYLVNGPFHNVTEKVN